MMAFLRSQKGSSTILIALLLVVLVVFGLLSLTTTASELKLAKRNAQSHKDFYALDSEGVKFVSRIGYQVNEAWQRTKQNAHEDFFLALNELLEKEFHGLRTEVLLEEQQRLRIYKAFALENGRYTKYLNITLEITEPRSLKEAHDALNIVEWRLWQEPFEYNNTIDLWEGLP